MHTPLTTGQRAWLEAELTQRLQQLQAQLAAHRHGLSSADSAAERLAQDADDAPQRAPELAVTAALTAHEQRELRAVNEALDRLARHDYGRCADCGDDIAFDRLKAEPWAARCLACATVQENAAAGAQVRPGSGR